MCQWGAKGMAEKGYNTEEILQFYYPGTRIEKIY
jgi:stage II sporulation protein D